MNAFNYCIVKVDNSITLAPNARSTRSVNTKNETSDDDLANTTIIDPNLTIDEKIIFYKERQCLLLLLKARAVLSTMIIKQEEEEKRKRKLKNSTELEERKSKGKLSLQEIQNLIHNSAEEDDRDLISELQDLKKQLIMEMRKNHSLERDLAKLDKRIALLIKNRTSLQDVMAASKRLTSQRKVVATQIEPKQLEHYQDLFYLLQTNPRYLAQAIYMINRSQLDSFVETVILSLFGDSYSPRDEFLLLGLFKASMEIELTAITSVLDFITGGVETVLPHIINTYNRRKQGLDYLKNTVTHIIKAVISIEKSLDVQPRILYGEIRKRYESEEECPLPSDVSEKEAFENPQVRQMIAQHQTQLESLCQFAVDVIVKSLDNLPFGLRWLMKQLREISLKCLPNTKEEEILKIINYFIFYRFLNLAIVTPDICGVYTAEIPAYTRKNLIAISRILQRISSGTLFDPSGPEFYLTIFNPLIEKNFSIIHEFMNCIYKVPSREEQLQVNKYLELAQRAKPVIVISLYEIYLTHALLYENMKKIAPDAEDPLQKIMNELGPPANEFFEEDREREIQLTLTNRFKVEVDDESENLKLLSETKELMIPILRSIPFQSSSFRVSLMDVLAAGLRFAQQYNNLELRNRIRLILSNLTRLEEVGMVTHEDNYESFIRLVALEVTNRRIIRDQQKKEVTRLRATLSDLREHQKFVDDSIKSYQDYLAVCNQKQLALAQKLKKRKKNKQAIYKISPVKFTYKALVKKGVIIDSDVPQVAKKRTFFVISSQTPGIFVVEAKISGVVVEKISLDFSDLLEKHYCNITALELDNVTLDVNNTINLINSTLLS